MISLASGRLLGDPRVSSQQPAWKDTALRTAIVGAVLLSMSALGGPTAWAAATPTSTSLPKAYLVGLSVADIDRSISFYSRHFGFTPVERKAFPDLNMEIAFLERNGFRLELVELANSQARMPPDPANDASMRGLAKLAFAVSDVDGLVTLLKADNVKVVVAPFDDRERGFRGALVRDPDGTLVGLYQLGR
jgi:catechol 2,3-dioxygenase-like lactoylglutathione lyase family enzyme